MKKLLCYLGIIILLGLILFPILLRLFLPDKIEEKELKVIERMVLSCSSDKYITSTSYDGDKVNMIIIKKLKQEEIEENNVDRSDNILSIFESLKDKNDILYKELDDGEVISIDYTLSEHKDLEIENLKNKVDVQKSFYEDLGLTCTIIK